MERLLLLHVDVKGAAAEVALNGFPVCSVPATGGRVCVPVHEYAISGANQLTLRVGPDQPVQPIIGSGLVAARVTLSLCTQGQSPLDPNARILEKVEWLSAPRERHDWPYTSNKDVELPVSFPRWRWSEAPVLTMTEPLRLQALLLMQQLALDLEVGASDNLIALCRLRFEELAVAYQRTPESISQGLRDQIQQTFESGQLKITPPTESDLILKPIAGGRLIECLGTDGWPILRTPPDESGVHPQLFWPLRMAHVNGQFYALR